MSVAIKVGDALSVLNDMPDASVDCVISSPPYYGLRDYQAEGQLGAEPTLREYLFNLLAIFEQVKRVLKPTGTLFVNIGDSYNNTRGPQGKSGVGNHTKRQGFESKRTLNEGFKPKDLMQVPARFAIAMQDELGFWLRNAIIWHKPNPLPFSGKDRFTNAYEHIYFFTKSAHYFFDQDAVRTPIKDISVARLLRGVNENKWNTEGAPYQPTMGKPRRNIRKAFDSTQGGGGSALKGHSGYVGANGQLLVNPKGANRRDVWVFPTSGYKGAHFATFPEALPEMCIKAGCPEGGVVLDPFGGSGTTGVVAQRLGRDCILIELNPEYAQMAHDRIDQAQTGKKKRIRLDLIGQVSMFELLDDKK